MAANPERAPRLGDYHVEEAGPTLGTLVEILIARVHRFELEVEQLSVRIAELEAAAMGVKGGRPTPDPIGFVQPGSEWGSPVGSENEYGRLHDHGEKRSTATVHSRKTEPG
jgi:hypothetical protein